MPARSIGARATPARSSTALVADGWPVVVTGARGDAAAGGGLRRRHRPVRPHRPGRARRRAAGAEAVVVGNTGPAHLAAAVGTPVVSLFAPVVPAARWRPWGVPHVLLGDQEAACRATARTRVPGRPATPA